MYPSSKIDGIVVIKPKGILDITNAYVFRDWVKKNFVENGERIIAVDLSELDSVDSFALGMFIALYKDTKLKGEKFFLVNPSKKVKRVIEITSIDKIIPVVESVSKIKEMVE